MYTVCSSKNKERRVNDIWDETDKNPMKLIQQLKNQHQNTRRSIELASLSKK
jgi:uncharacterized protein YjiS (DUF1127 family)